MSGQPTIVDVQISLDTTPVTQAGFGIPIFASQHQFFTERVRTYNSIDSVGDDFPTYSNEYIAATGFFSADISPSTIKIGRRKVDTFEFTVVVDGNSATVGDTFTISITDETPTTVDAQFVATGGETAADVVADLVADLAPLTNVTVTDNLDGTFDVGTSLEDGYTINSYTASGTGNSITSTFTSSETAATLVSEIEDVDNDWYMITSNDHSDTFVNDPTEGMAFTISSRDKLYIVSSQATETLVPWTGVAPAGDVVGQLKEDNRQNSAGLFHHQADTIFPECNYISRFAPRNPGTTVWTNKEIGVSASQNPTTGNVLTGSELLYLRDRDCNFVQIQGGVPIVRTGNTASGDDIENVRFKDFLTARITEAYQLNAINVEKVPYTDDGINSKRNVLETVLSRYVSTAGNPQGLQSAPAYTTNFPRRKDVDPNDVLAGLLTGEFTGFLSSAIKDMIIRGSLTIEGLAA